MVFVACTIFTKMCDHMEIMEAQKSLNTNGEENIVDPFENTKATESIDISIKNISELIEDAEKEQETKKATPRLTLKRSSRRQSGSIIQSAIARKERACDYDTKSQPRRGKKIKNEKNLHDQGIEKNDNTNLIVKKQKCTKLEFGESGNSESALLHEVDLPLRRSGRILSSDKDDSKTTNNKTVGHDNQSAENSVNPRLCKCTENKNLYLDSLENESVFCTATDSIDGKIIGCSKLVDCRKMPMLRPSQRVPFGVMCETHLNRLIRHNCCPTCGLFCSQGKFAQCNNKHQYHRNCQTIVEDRKCCPHCGSENSSDIFITMHCSKKPVFLPIQKTQE